MPWTAFQRARSEDREHLPLEFRKPPFHVRWALDPCGPERTSAAPVQRRSHRPACVLATAREVTSSTDKYPRRLLAGQEPHYETSAPTRGSGRVETGPVGNGSWSPVCGGSWSSRLSDHHLASRWVGWEPERVGSCTRRDQRKSSSLVSLRDLAGTPGRTPSSPESLPQFSKTPGVTLPRGVPRGGGRARRRPRCVGSGACSRPSGRAGRCQRVASGARWSHAHGSSQLTPAQSTAARPCSESTRAADLHCAAHTDAHLRSPMSTA